MDRIVVCYKWVVEEQDITVDSSGTITMRNPAYKVSQYDRNAIEAGMLVSEATGAECVALTAGDAKCEKSRKEALCVGPAAGFAVVDEALAGADSLATANALAAALRKIGPESLIICGEGSGDDYAQQVGPRIAVELGLPFVGYVTDIAVEGDAATLKRESPEGMEVLQAQLPLVVSVAGDCNTPRIAGIKDVLGAGKKPFEKFTLADLGVEPAQGFKRTDVAGNRPDRKQVVVSGSADEIAAELVKHMVAEGVLG